jgi:flagellar biosynthesis protein FlhA
VQIVTDPARLEAMLDRLRIAVSEAEATGRTVVLVCAPALRPALRKVVLLGLDRLAVLSYPEVTGGGVRIETVGTVTGAHAIAA